MGDLGGWREGRVTGDLGMVGGRGRSRSGGCGETRAHFLQAGVVASVTRIAMKHEQLHLRVAGACRLLVPQQARRRRGLCNSLVSETGARDRCLRHTYLIQLRPVLQTELC